MSIWQNFKETDHSFEKKFFKAIIFFAFAVIVFIVLGKLLDSTPEVKNLFVKNSRLLMIFFFIGLGLSTFSFTAYYGSLNSWEEETEYSLSASLLSSLFWAIFWLSWGICSARITINFDPLTIAVKVVIAGLVIIPSMTAFVISHSLRKEMLEEKEKLNTNKKYFSGYFGLLCFPVYLVSLAILQFL